MPPTWTDVTEEKPTQKGWYFVYLNENTVEQPVHLRSLSVTYNSKGKVATMSWGLGEVLSEPLETYRYWQPVVFPNPPVDEQFSGLIEEDTEKTWEEERDELVAEAMANLRIIVELLDSAAYAGDETVDVLKVGCNMGRSMQLAIEARELLNKAFDD